LHLPLFCVMINIADFLEKEVGSFERENSSQIY
jgi:hypothetical protein